MMNPNDKKPASEDRGPGIDPKRIRPGMRVVCSRDAQFGVVDHVQGPDTIKLQRDANGVHHYIPMRWVTRVDDAIHVDRPGEQAMRDWSTEAPTRP